MVVFNHIICLIWALICVLSDATFGNPSDFTWKYNGEVNIGKMGVGGILELPKYKIINIKIFAKGSNYGWVSYRTKKRSISLV